MRKENEIEILKQFEAKETGVDLSFSELPKSAQEISRYIMSQCVTENEVSRALQRSVPFRDELWPFNHGKGIDSAMRFWKFHEKGGGIV